MTHQKSILWFPYTCYLLEEVRRAAYSSVIPLQNFLKSVWELETMQFNHVGAFSEDNPTKFNKTYF